MRVFLPARDPQERVDIHLQHRHASADSEVVKAIATRYSGNKAKLSDPSVPSQEASTITRFFVNRSSKTGWLWSNSVSDEESESQKSGGSPSHMNSLLMMSCTWDQYLCIRRHPKNKDTVYGITASRQ